MRSGRRQVVWCDIHTWNTIFCCCDQSVWCQFMEKSYVVCCVKHCLVSYEVTHCALCTGQDVVLVCWTVPSRHAHERIVFTWGSSMAVVIELQELDAERAWPRMMATALPRRLLHCPPLCTPGCQECGGDWGSTVGCRLCCPESARLQTVRLLVPLYRCRYGPSQRWHRSDRHMSHLQQYICYRSWVQSCE
jgi:hypothetical protein